MSQKNLCLSAGASKKVLASANAVIDELESERGLNLAPKQRAAIETALNENIMILTGGPGTGKTTIIDYNSAL